MEYCKKEHDAYKSVVAYTYDLLKNYFFCWYHLPGIFKANEHTFLFVNSIPLCRPSSLKKLFKSYPLWWLNILKILHCGFRI